MASVSERMVSVDEDQLRHHVPEPATWIALRATAHPGRTSSEPNRELVAGQRLAQIGWHYRDIAGDNLFDILHGEGTFLIGNRSRTKSLCS